MTGLTVATIALLGLVALAASWRARRRAGNWRQRSVWAQPLAALLLGLLLFPPGWASRDDELVVYTAGASPSPWRRLLWPRPEVALPESGAAEGTETAPDLATALRRHPATSRLRIEGDGLALRDQATAKGLYLRFGAGDAGDAAGAASATGKPKPPSDRHRRALLELQAPRQVQVGTQWQLEGRATAAASRVELRDPAGAVVDSVVPANGRFHLSGSARAVGALRFELRVLGDAQQEIETASVPLQAFGGEPMTVIVRAATPDPELKYWRRWAADAGIAVLLAAGLSDGIELRDGDAALTPQALATADLLVIDERAWGRLSRADVAAVQAAVGDGLGLLLRATDVPDAAVAADWAQLGWRVEGGAEAHSVRLDRRTGLQADALADHIEFTAAPVRAAAAEADANGRGNAGTANTGVDTNANVIALLRSDDGELLGAARDLGAGRVGIWRLQDSYRLQLAGEGARYASLWASVLSQLARPRVHHRPPAWPSEAWVDERMVLCGLGRAASVDAPDGRTAALDVDAAACAAYWPARPGWHRLHARAAAASETDPDRAAGVANDATNVNNAGSDGTMAFYVRARDDGPGLRADRDRVATARLAQAPVPSASSAADDRDAPTVTSTPWRPLPRWPFFIAWLGVMGWLMWAERRDGLRSFSTLPR